MSSNQHFFVLFGCQISHCICPNFSFWFCKRGLSMLNGCGLGQRACVILPHMTLESCLFSMFTRHVWLTNTIHLLFVSIQVSPSELVAFASNYIFPFDHYQANGVTLSETRFIYLSGNERVIRGKKNKTGLHCMKTEKGQFHNMIINGQMVFGICHHW